MSFAVRMNAATLYSGSWKLRAPLLTPRPSLPTCMLLQAELLWLDELNRLMLYGTASVARPLLLSVVL